jgi:RNA recognition motif-containing protein
MNIYVANIAYSAKDQDLRELFEAFGEVTSAKIIMDKATNRSRGFGFVEMSDDTAGKAAIEGTNGKPFHGRDLVVNEARPRTEGAGGGGGFRRKGPPIIGGPFLLCSPKAVRLVRRPDPPCPATPCPPA